MAVAESVPSEIIPPARLTTPTWLTNPPRSSVPPVTLTNPPAREFELPENRVPALTKTPPPRLLLPVRVVVPTPFCESEPTPESDALTTPLVVKMAVAESVPSEIVPPPRATSSAEFVRPPRSSVPPLMFRIPDPKGFTLPESKVPPVRNVPPE